MAVTRGDALKRDVCDAQVGVTAMLIASKYEEIWAPEVGRTPASACRLASQTKGSVRRVFSLTRMTGW